MMREKALNNYLPLSISFNDGSLGSESVLGAIYTREPNVLLLVGEDGRVSSGTPNSPNASVVFVNSSADAFWKFIEAHSQFTNFVVEQCRANESSFASVFVNSIYKLVVEFQRIDSAAIESREHWWPQTIDETVREYRSQIG